MSVWMIRAGKHGEYEQKFINENRVYLTWDRLAVDLAKLESRQAVFRVMEGIYTSSKTKTLQNWAGQTWTFAHRLQVGDIVLISLKTQPMIAVTEITGPYVFEADAQSPYFHWRSVKPFVMVPRHVFPQDLLYSMGSTLTIFKVARNDAELRIRAMRAANWKPESVKAAVLRADPDDDDESTEEDERPDLEAAGRDQIARLIEAQFKGHNLTRLVGAILRAKGYTIYTSPEGADGGADILAGIGPLGFGDPQLCVEVKSQSSPVDRPTVDKLLGAVDKFRARHGLFVSWGGFKPNVHKELATMFFKLRMWTRDDLLEQLFETYDRLDEDLRAELPLKRVWTVATGDEE